MAIYTIRVELHDASRTDYDNLAEYLRRQGITDVVTSDDGRRYKMSPAEYNYTGNANLDQVFSATQNAANLTGRRNAVMVTQAAARRWVGLASA